jgi:hypothetical protein
MDFDGIDKVREQVQQGQTLQNQVMQQQQQIAQLVQLIAAMKGGELNIDGQQQAAGGNSGGQQQAPTGKTAGKAAIDAASQNQTPYQQVLMQRATPNMPAGG